MADAARGQFTCHVGESQEYGGALQMPNVVSGVGKTVERAVKRKAQGVANRVIDRAAGALAKRAKRGVSDLLGA